MESPRLLPDHGNHCNICESLDYDPIQNQCSQSSKNFLMKQPVAIRSPFNLTALPDHLLDPVLEKMYYNSFNKFRRSNKKFFNYIDTRREKIRLAMFHDKSLGIKMIYGRNFISFSNYSCPYLNGKSFACLDRREEKQYENGMIRKKKSRNYITVTIGLEEIHEIMIEIFMSCDGFESNTELKKEFSGCYKPYLVSMCSPIVNLESVVHFLTMAHIKNVTFCAKFIDSSLFINVCEVLRPRTLSIDRIDDLPDDLLLRECFKETKALDYEADDQEGKLNLKPGNLKAFYAVSEVKETYLMNLIEAWIAGEPKIDEMWMQLSRIACLDQFAPLRIMDVTKSGKFKKVFKMRVCLLEQRSTGKKAFCVINRQDTLMDGRQDVVYFKTIE